MSRSTRHTESAYHLSGQTHRLISLRTPDHARRMLRAIHAYYPDLDATRTTIRPWGAAGVSGETLHIWMTVHEYAMVDAQTDPYAVLAGVEQWMVGPSVDRAQDMRQRCLHDLGLHDDPGHYHTDITLVHRRRGNGHRPYTAYALSRRTGPTRPRPTSEECLFDIPDIDYLNNNR